MPVRLKRDGWLPLIALVLAIGIIAVAVAGPRASISAANATETKTLSVSGSATLSEEPDRATILISVDTNASTALEAQQGNAKKMAAVQAAISLRGIALSIETVSFSVSPRYEWEDDKYVQKGYDVSHTIKVKTQKLDRVGEILDAATEAGANRIGSISFELSDDAKEQLRINALKGAMNNARTKAAELARAAGVSIVGTKSITESVSFVSPTPYYFAAERATAAAETPVQPAEVEVKADVGVVYDIY